MLAFRRTDLDPAGEGDLVVAVPRLFSGSIGDTMWSGEAFAGTTLALGAGTRWRDVVTGRTIDGEGARAPSSGTCPTPCCGGWGEATRDRHRSRARAGHA